MLCYEDTKKEIRTKRQKINQVTGSGKVRRVGECNKDEDICVIYYLHHLFSLDFLPNWEDKIMWARRDYFPPHFLSLVFSPEPNKRKFYFPPYFPLILFHSPCLCLVGMKTEKMENRERKIG